MKDLAFQLQRFPILDVLEPRLVLVTELVLRGFVFVMKVILEKIVLLVIQKIAQAFHLVQIMANASMEYVYVMKDTVEKTVLKK
jgi:hypothetical protein